MFALSSTTAAAAVLKDYSGTASGLFNNMRIPAALIGGTVVSLGVNSAPPIKENDSPFIKAFKKANLLLSVASLLSEILAVTYSSVAINKLAEMNFEPTKSVDELISKHFKLEWVGTNVHFLMGMFGFGLSVGSKAYFTYGTAVGKIAGLWSVATFLQCLAIVNRGIAMGDGSGMRFANNFFELTIDYMTLVVARARDGALPVAAVGLFLYSLVLMAKLLPEKKEKES
jgi:hypothetical protein